VVEAEAGKDGGGPRLGRMGVDVGQPGLDLGDAVRVGGGLRLLHQQEALAVGGKHDVDQRLLGAGSFLRDLADAGALRHRDAAGLGGEIARDGPEEGRLAGAVAADEACLGAGGQRQRSVVDQEPSGDAKRDVVEDQHGACLAEPRRARKRGSACGAPEAGLSMRMGCRLA
jgi:hypothetical protein